MNHASAVALPPQAAPTSAPATRPVLAPAAAELPVAILGVPFDPVTIEGALDRIDAMIATRRPHAVVTANVDFLVQAHRDVELRRILLEADLVLCDGTPVVWASRWLGNAVPERVAGSDLAPALISRAAARGHRVFLLGAAEGVAAEAAARLQAAHPGLHLVGHYSPPFSDLLAMNHEEIAQRVRAARPDILLVSFGCPKQEKWIAMHHRTLGVPVVIGVGATIDFLAGRVRRAPTWMRRSGTEWLYRLLQEPRRLYKRYATDFVAFLPTLATQRLALHGGHGPGRLARESTAGIPGWRTHLLGDALTRPALAADAPLRRAASAGQQSVLLDASSVRAIDATGLAFLIRWRKQLQLRDRHFVLLAPSRRLRRALEAWRLWDHFLVAPDYAAAQQLADTLRSHPAVLRDGTTRSLAWCGEINAANADDVWRMTTEHVEAFLAADTTLVIIDLARLRFIDSAGAGLMLRLQRWIHAQHAEVLFAHAQPNVRNVLRLAKADQLLLEGAQ